VQVEVLDAQGHLVADNRDAITLDIFDYQGAGSGISLHGTTTVNAVGGVATFSGLWLTGAGRYVLSATDTALGNESITDPFVVAPANPDQLTFPNQPLSIRGSDTLRTLTVVVRDQFGNDVTNYVPGNIALDFAVNPWAGVSPASGDSAPGAFLSGTTLLPPDSGRAVFAGLSVDKPGYGYQLRARLPSLPAVIPAVSSPFNVTLQFAPLVAAGNAHTCAVTTKGTYCWGSNSGGQLAGVTGPSGSDSVPQPASGGLSLVAIASKQAHTCGLTALGDAYCWGGAPLLVGGGHTFVAIAAGQSHNCAITGTGALYCWGSNASGQLGDGTKTFRSNPVLVAGGLSFKAVGAGSDFTCALTVAGAAYCWGSNTQGQMGTGGAAPDSVPQPVTGGHTFASLVAGLFHSCATATDSTAYCWGGNSSFQDGDGTGATTPHTSPNLVAGSHKYTALTAGELHTCGLIVGGAALCWGANDAGQLGPGFASSGTSNPLGVVGRVFTAVVAGGHHTCGLSGGALYCWGSDTFGQLGDGRSNMQLAPVRVVQ
jgi:alpha-tubulin suppressor-like RCC1 family protein